MNTTKLIMIGVVTALLAQRAHAWCEFNDGSTAPPAYAEAFLFEIEDDYTGWNDLLTGPGNLEQTDTTSPWYYKTVVENIVDASAQSWARVARVPIKVGFKDWNGTTEFADDGRSVISVIPCPSGGSEFVGNAEPEPNGAACDIQFTAAGTGCLGSPFQPAVVVGSDGFHQNRRSGIFRLLRHEIGHCLGLGHRCPRGDDCIDGGASLCASADNVCKCNAIMHDPNTDFPHGDDIEGIHESLRGVTASAIPGRRVMLQKGTISSTNVWADDGAAVDLGVYSSHPARVECRKGGISPECIMARPYNASEVRINTLDIVPSISVGTTLNVSVSTRRPVDIALSRVNSSFAVAVIAPQVQTDTTGENELTGVEVLRISKADTSGPGLTHRFEIDTSDGDDITPFEPRVTFVRTIGGTCSGSSDCGGLQCIEGFCANGNDGRFLVMLLDLNRKPVLYLSTDSGGTAFTQLAETTGVVPFLSQQMRDTFDIACPHHTTTSGTAEDRLCRVVFTPYGDNEDADSNPDNPNAHLRQCTLDVDGNSFDVVACSGLGFGAVRGAITSLTDYGTGTPTGQRTARSWLMTVSEPNLHNLGSVRNSNLTAWNHNTNNLLSTGDLVLTLGYAMDRQSCTAMTADDDPKTYFGGTSIDYCEDCTRIIRLDWGQFNASGVPSDKCF